MAQKMTSAWSRARRHLAGGVNSPVRAFRAVGAHPVFMQKAKGSRIVDIEGRSYVDYCLSWGALLKGHAPKEVVRAVSSQAKLGTSFGCATEIETALAESIQMAFPGMERIRFTSSGTEAAMSAVRLARGFTGRKKILKFEGCYHGHADGMLVKAGSGLATFGSPDSAGIPEEIASLTAVLPYNDTAALDAFFRRNKDIACVIVEPVAANMGVVTPHRGFLKALRDWTRRTGSLLIFDEVITGYRLCYGGAQHVYDIAPDLTVLGKIIGGGLPVGAFGGARRIMEHLSPLGKVYQAGTLSGNPLSMAAGLQMLRGLDQDFYHRLNERTAHFVLALEGVLEKKGVSASIQRAGSMFTIFYRGETPENFREVCDSDLRVFRKVFHGLLKQGIYTPPSAFEASFLSAAHAPSDLDRTLDAFKRVL